MEGVLKTVLASNVPPDVWEQANSEILQRHVIRRNVDIRLKLRQDPSLPAYQRVLRMESSYDLYGLILRPTKYTIRNGFNSHLVNKQIGLPRFESAIIGTKAYGKDELTQMVEGDLLTLGDVELSAKGGEPVKILIERSEIVNTPSDYVIVFTELTQGVTLHFEEVPEDVKIEVSMGAEKGLARIEHIGKPWIFRGVLFPGQSLTVSLKANATNPGVAP
jgi:hypothetical protein